MLKHYHPHGDSAVYDSMVRMAQDFSLRYPLVDGQGNFGSIDGDPPAAYRYTEARLTRARRGDAARHRPRDGRLRPNFDGGMMEPVVLPTRFPNLLANGSSGIAVGMATNVPPHNLRELIDALTLVVRNPACTLDDLLEKMPGPRLPDRRAHLRHATASAPPTPPAAACSPCARAPRSRRASAASGSSSPRSRTW